MPPQAPRPNACVVLSTVPNEEAAVNIARALLDDRLVACVNVVPGIRSLYRWQGKLEDERELLLVMKTQASLYERLEARIRELHPYEVCEVLQLGVEAGSAPYLAWISSQTG